MPWSQFLDSTDLLGVRPAKSQERPQQQAARRPHPGQRTGTRTTGKAQQHLLGLVVQGVAQQDGVRSLVYCGRFKRCVPGFPGSGFRAKAGTSDRYGPDFHWGKAQFLQDLRSFRRHLGRNLLQLVVHHHRAHCDGVAVNVPAAGEVGCH
jgi:hypothetical protein